MNVYQEDQTFRLASNLSANNITKYTTLDNMFRGYSLADEKIDNTVAVAMALSHTIDENGNVVRLTDDMKANGKKNVIELMNTDENDKLYIEGMKERAYLQFRAKIRSVTGSIKGQMASDDINAINTMLAGQLLMMYRNWMPRVVKERLGKFRYNPVTKDFEQGRYRFVASHAFNEQTTFVSLLRDVAHTGLRMFWLMDNFNKYKLGRPGTSGYDRARLVVENEYKKFLKQYEGDVRFTEGFTIDDYIDLKAGQLRAFIAEARVIVLFLSAMVAGGMDWDDDGQKEYKDLWATRKLYQVLNRAQSEWSFIWNPMEWKNFFQNPLAMSGIFTDIINITRNTIDEMRDNAFGENANNDTTPWFYFSSKMLPGINNMIRFGEVFKQDMERTR